MQNSNDYVRVRLIGGRGGFSGPVRREAHLSRLNIERTRRHTKKFEFLNYANPRVAAIRDFYLVAIFVHGVREVSVAVVIPRLSKSRITRNIKGSSKKNLIELIFQVKFFFFLNKIIHRSRNVEWFIVLFYTLRTSERRKICRVLVSPNLMLRVQEAIYFQLIYIYTACLNPGHGRGFNVSWTEESVYEFVKWWKEYRRMTISLFFIDYACKLQRNLSRYIIMANAIPLSFQETQNCSTAILGLLLIILKMNFRLLI